MGKHLITYIPPRPEPTRYAVLNIQPINGTWRLFYRDFSQIDNKTNNTGKLLSISTGVKCEGNERTETPLAYKFRDAFILQKEAELTPAKSVSLPFEELWKDFVKSNENHWKTRTRKNYSTLFNRLKDFHKNSVAEISTDVIDKIRQEWEDEEHIDGNGNKKAKKTSSISQYLTQLSAFFRYLCDYKELPKNPVTPVLKKIDKILAVNGRPTFNILSIDLARNLLDECQKSTEVTYTRKNNSVPITIVKPPVEALWRIIFVGLRTGLRKKNILGMTWNHIDFAKNYIHFAFKEVKRCPSADGLYIPLHPELREWLEMLIRKNNGNPFPGNELVIGKHYYNPNYELIKKKEKAVGINFHNGFVENEPLHLMRHTLETWILMKSGQVVADAILGHKTKAVSEVYNHIETQMDFLLKEFSKVERIFPDGYFTQM